MGPLRKPIRECSVDELLDMHAAARRLAERGRTPELRADAALKMLDLGRELNLIDGGLRR